MLVQLGLISKQGLGSSDKHPGSWEELVWTQDNWLHCAGAVTPVMLRKVSYGSVAAFLNEASGRIIRCLVGPGSDSGLGW
jgi:hypothetical protein